MSSQRNPREHGLDFRLQTVPDILSQLASIFLSCELSIHTILLLVEPAEVHFYSGNNAFVRDPDVQPASFCIRECTHGLKKIAVLRFFTFGRDPSLQFNVNCLPILGICDHLLL